MIINSFIIVLILATMTAAIGFVAIYAAGPWRVSHLGKATMLWAFSMIVWCSSGLVYSFLGTPSWYPWLRLAAYLFTCVAMWTMLILLLKTSRTVRVERRKDNAQL